MGIGSFHKEGCLYTPPGGAGHGASLSPGKSSRLALPFFFSLPGILSFSHPHLPPKKKKQKNAQMQLWYLSFKVRKTMDEKNLTSSQMSDQTETSAFLNPIT